MTHNEIKLHEALNKNHVAFQYYKILHPQRKYELEHARKQFLQDNNIDLKTVRKAIKMIFEEQVKLLAA